MPARPRDILPLALLLLATLALSLAAAGDGTLPGDVRLARWLQAHPIPYADPLTAFTNRYVSGLPLTLAGIALTAALLAARRSAAARLIALATLLRAANAPLKLLVDSPRPTPDLVSVTEHAHGLGFPSGHAMGATLLLGALACLLTRPSPPLPRQEGHPAFPPLPGQQSRPAVSPLPGGEGPGVRAPQASSSAALHRPARSAVPLLHRAGVLVCLALILLTGYGRILVGAHWPTDVLGGDLWGTLLLLLAIHITRAGAGRSTAGASPSGRG